MRASGLIKASPRLTVISGMLWVRTNAGDEELARVAALEAEHGKEYGPLS